MLTILLILTTSLVAGRVWLALTRRRATLADALLGYVVWVMLAAFGYRIGADPEVMSQLPALGLRALLLGAAALAASAAAVFVCLPKVLPDVEPSVGRQGGNSASGLSGSAFALLFFIAGLAGGNLSLLPVTASQADTVATWLLWVLMGLVGLSTGSNPRLVSVMRGLRPAIIAVPAVSVIATLAAGAAVGALCGLGAPDGATAVSGMGYYSLSSMIISDLRADDMGTAAAMSLAAIALMSNLSREILSFVLVPLLGRRIGVYAASSMCGVTSMDVTLPTLAATFGPGAVPVALVNGILLEVTTPFTVMAACSVAASW